MKSARNGFAKRKFVFFCWRASNATKVLKEEVRSSQWGLFNAAPAGLKMSRIPSGSREPADSVRLRWLQANVKPQRSHADGQTDHNTVTMPDDASGALVKTQPAGAISYWAGTSHESLTHYSAGAAHTATLADTHAASPRGHDEAATLCSCRSSNIPQMKFPLHKMTSSSYM